MKTKFLSSGLHAFVFIAFQVILINSLCAQSREVIDLWSGVVPGEVQPKHQAVVTPNKDGATTRLTDVTNPNLTVFRPEKGKSNGSSVIVCPGGGYNILAIDKEGYEVGEWLTSLGFTAFVLQYRVPQKLEGALMDLQRAIRYVRATHEKFGISSARVGVIGFSAGGSLSARASTRFSEQTYPITDSIDQMSCRPDFALLIYPAYLDKGENRSITPELKLGTQTPPMFLFASADDPYGNSALVMAGALRDNKTEVELHFVPKGGHGYGLRPGNPAAEIWPSLASKWLLKLISAEK